MKTEIRPVYKKKSLFVCSVLHLQLFEVGCGRLFQYACEPKHIIVITITHLCWPP